MAAKFKLRQITFQVVFFFQFPTQIPSRISLYPDNVTYDVRQFLLDFIAQIKFSRHTRHEAHN